MPARKTASFKNGFSWALKQLLVFQFCFLAAVSSVNLPAVADNPPRLTLLENLQVLERKLSITPAPQATLADRLSTIEHQFLGSEQSGPVLGRLARINELLIAKPPVPSSMPAVPAETLPTSSEEAMDRSVVPSGSVGAIHDSMPLLNAIPPNFLRMEPPEVPVATSDDYFNDVLKSNKGKILRFKAMPVPIFVTAYPDKQFMTCAVRGFQTWEHLTDGVIRFTQVDDPEKARIIVSWKRLGKAEDGSGCMLGAHTITRYTDNGKGSLSVVSVGMVPVPVYIPKLGPKYTVPPQVIEVNLDLLMSKNPSIRYRLLQNVVTHELGHALGMLGHSPNSCDIMYSVTDEHSRLSTRDVNTIIKLYKQKLEIPL